MMLQQRHDAHESFAGTCRIVLNIAVEQQAQRLAEPAMAEDLRTGNRSVLE